MDDILKKLKIQKFEINFDEKLSNNILELKKTLKSAQASNKGGWQGVVEHNTDIDWVKQVRTQIENATNHKTARFWFNINGPKHYNDWHIHDQNRLVCVAYVKVPENSGDIEFRTKFNNLTITPYNGLVLIFPGTLDHRVLSNESIEYRISISANLINK